LKKNRIKFNENTNKILINFGQSPLQKEQALTFYDFLARPNTNINLIKNLIKHLTPEILSEFQEFENLHFELETEIKYAGYLQRQEQQIDKLNNQENKKIPADFNYNKLIHLSKEAREKLSRIKPETIGLASKIDGVRNSDISILLLSLAVAQKG